MWYSAQPSDPGEVPGEAREAQGDARWRRRGARSPGEARGGAGDLWLPKREGTHEVGRSPRRHSASLRGLSGQNLCEKLPERGTLPSDGQNLCEKLPEREALPSDGAESLRKAARARDLDDRLLLEAVVHAEVADTLHEVAGDIHEILLGVEVEFVASGFVVELQQQRSLALVAFEQGR